MSQKTPDDHHGSLLKWIEELGGGLSDGVEIYDDPKKGKCLRVRQDYTSEINGSTCAVRCPVIATISYMNICKDVEGVPAHGFNYSPEFMDAVNPAAAVAFFLMDQYLRQDASFWAPYIRSLPKPDELTTVQHYEDEDLKWLEGTNLCAARELRFQEWRSQYDQGLRALKNTSSNTYVSSYTWELFLWAYTIYTSRAFTSKMLFGYFEENPHAKIKDPEVFPVLIPLVDLSNHQPLAKVEWRAETSEVGLMMPEGIQPGQEIPNNYGPRSNLHLMMSYGFCIVDNVCDNRDVVFTPPPGSALHDAKEEQVRRYFRSGEKPQGDEYFMYNIFHPVGARSKTIEGCVFSPDLLDSLSVAAANARETAHIEVEKNRLYIGEPPLGASRIVLNGLSQIVIELFVHIMKLRKGGYLGMKAQNQKQHNAQIYRQSQIMLAENALLIAEWTLSRARFHEDVSPVKLDALLDNHLSYVPEERFGLPVRQRLRSLITERGSMVKSCGELFVKENVMSTLPRKTRDTVHAFIKDILQDIAPVIESSELENGTNIFIYCVFLCFCIGAYRKGTDKGGETDDSINSSLISHRLYNWVDFLLQSYVEPEEEDEQWMLDDNPFDSLLSNIYKLLKTVYSRNPETFAKVEQLIGPWKNWLSGNWLRWAWITAEQESLMIAKDTLQLAFGNDAEAASIPKGLHELNFEYYLYIPKDSKTPN